MNAWTALDAFLTIEHNINYWEDDAVDRGLELLEAMDADGWTALDAARARRPPHWRRQLASALCDDESPQGRAALAALLTDPALDVALQAAESLEGRDDLPLPAGIQPALRALLGRLDGPDLATVQALLDRA